MAPPLAIDFSHLTSDSETQRQETATQLLQSLSKHGYAKIINHSILDEEVEKLFDMNRKFFKLPDDVKRSFAHKLGPNPQRGWSRVGSENSSTLYQRGILQDRTAKKKSDAREHWDQGSALDTTFPNIWPAESELPGFRSIMEDAYSKLEVISGQCLEALGTAMGLKADSFTNRTTHENNASEFRFNHYPSISVAEIRAGDVARIHPHFDLGVITLLFQDSVGGLEFENRDEPGTFERVPCGKPSEIVLNVSETLQRWTNGCLPAGLHRVNLPEHLEHEANGVLPERYSIAYFTKADRNASVGPLEQFVDRVGERRYEDVSAIEYHQQRLLSAY